MSMGKQKMEVVTLQLPTHQRYHENLDALITLVEYHKDKDLIVAPEVCLTGFDYAHMDTVAKFSILALKSLKKIIDNQIMVLTLVLKEKDQFVNQAVVIHKHKVIYRQNKVKLFTLGEEQKYFKAGPSRAIKPFEIDGVKYALLICFELRFKELWKRVEGVDVIIIPARWGLPRKAHLEVLSRALAVMNQCYVIVSNSSDGDMAKSSSIISPNGEVIQEDTSLSVTGMIDFQEIKKMRRYINMQ
ncbi:carbon-nitrogen hydrolase family protein [Sulfurovum sp. zt1-1]|uniref:Carbon-nitrogen hydrolase family protein n=1 Tax=Sulfurovum zhangzhouensis TaxID=3019067 RepID=A0ABT7R0D7_9BACT|nr:carbon-nitrogen hydrolase family protein [Sulfurovum zhangzhouensis]MDM5272561.1 carbon-nitrogen hydrolase family protein [Sulfurovum zhangzhouensis]